MSDDDGIVLRNRLIGAATLCLVAFLLSLLIPEPAREEPASGEVVINLSEQEVPAGGSSSANSEPEPVTRKPVQPAERERADEKPVQAAKNAQEQATASKVEARKPEPASKPAPTAQPKRATEAPDSREPATQQPSTPSQTQRSGRWWIQAAAYSDRETAAVGKRRAAALGHPTRLREVRIDGKRWWRLQIGPFATKRAAESELERVEAAGFRGARALERP